MNYYNLLGLPFDATQEEIRKAYFEAAKKFHPDVNDSNVINDHFIQIQRAYEILIDEESRNKYNLLFENDDKKESKIQINAYYSRSTIPLISENQFFYLLLDIFSSETVNDNDLPAVNLCFVIDKSTSMQGLILDNLKVEIANLIRLLSDEDIVSIVAFSDNAEVIVPPCKIKDIGGELSKIHLINASGSTEILKGLNEGINILDGFDNQQTKLLLLITDGHTYGDEEASLQKVGEASQKGIIFQAIGVGQDWNDDFLDSLSSIAGGETQFVTSSQELYNLLKEKITNFGVIFSKSVRISFNLHPKVKMNYAFRVNPDLSKLDIGSEINLGNLYSEKHLRVILEFIIEELPIEISELRFSHGAIKIETPSKSIFMKRFFYDFKRPVFPKLTVEKIPPIIVNALTSLSLYRLQEKAREDVKNGDYDTATKRLNSLATHLLTNGNSELAKTIIKEVEFIHNTKNFSELGKKKIKYGTRSLLLSPKS